MSDFFKNNLIFLREKRGENQTKTASELGLSRSTYANYESGANQPKADGINKIVGHFGVSFEELMNVDLTSGANRRKKSDKIISVNGANEGAKHGANTPENHEKWEINRSYLDLDSTHANNVYDFESKAAAGEAIALFDKDKTRVQPNLYLPHLGPGIHIRVPITGDSMHSTIKDSDKIVGTLLTDISELRQGYIYAILDKNDGLVCKRVYLEGKNTIELVSDNEIYKPYKRHLKDIASMFRVREVHSTDLRPYFDDIRREMREIRTRMADFERMLSK